MINKIDEVKAIVCDIKPDIVCFVETWTNSEHTNALLSITDFNIIARADRKDTTAGIGGGLIIYARKDINIFEHAIDPDIDVFNQHITVKLPLKNNTVLSLVLVYRPHKLYNGEQVVENNELLCKLLAKSQKPAVFVGDFNYPDIDWTTMTAKNDQSRKLVNVIEDKFYTQHVDFPTHVSGSLIDLVISTEQNLIINTEDIGRVGASDHNAILCQIQSNISLHRKEQTRENWKNANIEQMNMDINAVNWEVSFDELNTEECWNIFTEFLDHLLQKHVPKMQQPKSKQPPWLNRELLRLVRTKRRKWKKYKETNSQQYLEQYKELEKKVKKGTRNAKKNYERKLAKDSKSNPKLFYSYLKSKTSNRESVGPLKASNNHLVTDEKEMAEMLNNFFGSVFTREDLTIIPPCEQSNITHPMQELEFTPDIVKDKLIKLKKHSAPGPDGIKPRLLIDLADSVKYPLSIIFNKSYEKSEIPLDWKRANVAPIFKKGKKYDVGNYRPVSLTSIVCKVMESEIKDSVTEHLEINKVIRNTQHGFRKKQILSN